MKNTINKKLIAIVGTACACVIAITGTLVAVMNSNNSKSEEKEVASIESQKTDEDSKEAETDNMSIMGEEVTEMTSEYDEAEEDENNSETSSNIEDFGENEVVKCTRQIVIDPQTQVAVMSVLVPEGWSTSCYVDWTTYVNEKMPGRAFIELSSPNNDINVLYVSPMFFVQTNADTYVGNYHKSVENLMTELDYMNAQDYTQHMLELSQISMQTSMEEYIDPDKQNKLKNVAYDGGLKRCDYLNQTIGASYGNSSMGYSVNLTDYDGRTYIQHGISNINGMECYTETI